MERFMNVLMYVIRKTSQMKKLISSEESKGQVFDFWGNKQ